MIDVNRNPLRILPAEHIAFKDFDYAVGVEKKINFLKKGFFGLFKQAVLC